MVVWWRAAMARRLAPCADNGVGEWGAARLAEALQRNSILTSLHLGGM